jgi:hypothetical protein
MKSCPECGATLNEGVVTVKGPTPQFFIPLFADQHLWFIQNKKKLKILHSEERRSAYICISCGTVCISPAEPTETFDMEDVTKRIAARLEKRHGKNRN